MQDEVNERTVSLCVQGGRMTAGVLKAAMRKFLLEMEKQKQKSRQEKQAERNGRAKERGKAKEIQRQKKKTPHGKQTIRQLMAQGAQLTNIQITDQNIRSFDRVARKYGIDYSLKKDSSVTPPKYYVFFKAKDVDVMTAAFRQYAGVSMKKGKKPSVKKKLAKAIQRKAKHRQKERTRKRDRGQER